MEEQVKTLIKVCITCKLKFKKPMKLSYAHWDKRLFCSKDCRRKGMKVMFANSGNPFWKGGLSTIKRSCKQCYIEFMAHASNVKKGNGNYCSNNCRALWFSRNLRGEKHPNWRGKTSQNKRDRESKDYVLWRTAVFTRDDYTCQSCGDRGEKLNADHIKPFAYYPDLRFAIDNGRTLCVDCHKQTDTYGWKARSYENN